MSASKLIVDDRTNQQQALASNPKTSVWVSANAGSGKTTVLARRVVRLLLNDTDPSRILCITYTKAAAGEMANKVFETLGDWAVIAESDLREELSKIEQKAPTKAQLERARTLFARALETPGGLKIQTIHAFCAQILRRFPVEAGVSPQFSEMDERQIAQLQTRIVEEIAAESGENCFDALAAELADEGSLPEILNGIQKHRVAVANGDRDRLADALGVDPETDEHAINLAAMERIATSTLQMVHDAFERHGGKTENGLAPLLKTALQNIPVEAKFAVLEEVVLTKGRSPRSTTNFPTASVKKAMPDALEIVIEIQEIVTDARKQKFALQNFKRSETFNRFGQAFLERFEAIKSDQGLLDFDDLINRVRQLLADPSVADWVLYRLDEGIDHILVDEAQDTSPTQWDVIKALEAAFSDGVGARSNIKRTLFVVGDKKQSIFGFQGADPDAFNDYRDHFEQRRARVKQSLQVTSLNYSFRSAKPILELVDAVFANPNLPALDDTVIHRSFPDKPGRVDLWEWKTKDAKADPPRWNAAVDQVLQSDPVIALAGEMADHIADLVFNGAQMPGTLWCSSGPDHAFFIL